MQGIKRRIVYVALFEVIAIALTTCCLAFVSGREIGQSGIVATLTSVLAIVWNFAYNAAFEYVEAKRARPGRSMLCRAAHAVGFELGLALMVVPMLAHVLRISLWAALLTNIGLMLFFMFYAFVFNLAFDKVFGLPLSAQAKPE